MDKESGDFFADECIKITIRNNKPEDVGMWMVISGIGNSFLPMRDGETHDYVAMIDAIYRYHDMHSEIDVNSYYQNALDYMSKVIGNHSQLLTALNVFAYEYNNELRGLSPFTVDIASHMNKVKQLVETSDRLKDNGENMKLFESYVELLKK